LFTESSGASLLRALPLDGVGLGGGDAPRRARSIRPPPQNSGGNCSEKIEKLGRAWRSAARRGPRAPAALSCVRVNDRHELVDRRGEIPIGGRNGLAIPRREHVPPQEAHRELTPPQTGNPLSPSYYLIFTALVSLAALIAIQRRSRRRDRTLALAERAELAAP